MKEKKIQGRLVDSWNLLQVYLNSGCTQKDL